MVCEYRLLIFDFKMSIKYICDTLIIFMSFYSTCLREPMYKVVGSSSLKVKSGG